MPASIIAAAFFYFVYSRTALALIFRVHGALLGRRGEDGVPATAATTVVSFMSRIEEMMIS